MADNVITTIEKTPNENLMYGFDWTNWLVGGDTVLNAGVWTSTPSGLNLGATGFSTTATSQRVSGGTVGETYQLTNKMTTANGNIGERTLIIQVVATKGQ